MAKPKSKKLPHLSQVLKIISKNQKDFPNVSGWRNNSERLNTLVSILVTETHPSIEQWWDSKIEYSDSQVSNIVSGKSFIHHLIWQYYQGTLKELPSNERLTYREHINQLTEKLKNKDNKFSWRRPPFLTNPICQKIYEYFDSCTGDIGDLDLKRLEKKLRSGECEDFFASILFFIAADMPQIEDNEYGERHLEIIKSSQRFFNDIAQDLNEGKYYDYYHRKIIVTPDIKQKKIINEHTLSFKAPLLNRSNNLSRDSLQFNFSFDNFEKYDFFSMKEMAINGVDFLDKHIPLPENPEVKLEDRYCYKKRFLYPNIPDNTSYEVRRTTQALLGFPITESTYHLPFSTNDFKFEISMSQLNKDDNMFFDIFCAFFTPFDRTTRLSFIKSSSKHFEVHIKEFVPKGSGVKVIIKPSLSNLNFSTGQNINLTAEQINITGVWETRPETDYKDE